MQLGLAYAAKGKNTEAVNELKQSLLVAGMDHNLTSTALLELGKLAFRASDFPSASTYFLEATYSAALRRTRITRNTESWPRHFGGP